MRDLAVAGRAILLDLASTLFFLLLFALTGSVPLSVALGIALAAVQIGWRLLRRERIDALQWVSLLVVAASGAATLFTRDPRFVMLKPSVIYLLVGWAMLQKGWMLRYLPARAIQLVPDLAVAAGYAWAGLMGFSALLNITLAMTCPILTWGTAMTVWGIGSKLALFLLQYGVMRYVGRRRAMGTRSA